LTKHKVVYEILLLLSILAMKRFIDCIIPFKTCNLRCDYCYITHTKSWGRELPLFHYDAEQIGRALSVVRLGGEGLINICGEGETLLPPETTGIVYNILNNGHYVMLVTNGTLTNRFNEIIRFPKDFLDRLLIKFSFHYLELKKRNLFNNFFDNVKRIRDSGCSISLELTPSDEAIPYIEHAISICKAQAGAICHVTVARNERNPSLSLLTQHTRPQYENIWNRFQSDLFKFKMRVYGEKRKEYCYAGCWSGLLNLVTGELKQCYRGDILQNIYENIEKPIYFSPIGRHCPEPYCFNAHAFMTLGVIPSIKAPKFTEMRNRLCQDGTEWLKPSMKKFLDRKLSDYNAELTSSEKYFNEIRRFHRKSRITKKLDYFFSRTFAETPSHDDA